MHHLLVSAIAPRELTGLCSGHAQIMVAITGRLCILHPPAMSTPSILEPQHWELSL